MDRQTDILLVTVNKNETKAVLKTFAAAVGKPAKVFNEDDLTYHALGELNGKHVVLVRSEMGGVGLGGSLQTVAKSIGALNPQAVVMVGVAFGMDATKQVIGQVLVATRIMSYEPQRVGTGADGKEQIIPRGARADVSTKLLRHLRAADDSRENDDPKVSFGLIVSGEKLVDNQELLKQLRGFEPEAIGGEMEGAGLYAACQDAKVDWILVKAICDWADGNKDHANTDSYQVLAATHSATFVIQALQLGNLLEAKKKNRASISAAPNSPGLIQTVTLTLNGRLGDFTAKRKQTLITVIASLAGIKEKELQIISIVPGSVRITLAMPAPAIRRLCENWEAVQTLIAPPSRGRAKAGASAAGWKPARKVAFANELVQLNVSHLETRERHVTRKLDFKPRFNVLRQTSMAGSGKQFARYLSSIAKSPTVSARALGVGKQHPKTSAQLRQAIGSIQVGGTTGKKAPKLQVQKAATQSKNQPLKGAKSLVKFNIRGASKLGNAGFGR